LNKAALGGHPTPIWPLDPLGICSPDSAMVTHSRQRGYVMDRVSVDLQYCFGIKALKHEFDFSDSKAFAIYAPNGAMKSSFALTFKALSIGDKPKDRIFPDRPTRAIVQDEAGAAIANDRVLVVLSYDEELAPSEKTCTLLVDTKLRAEFAELQTKVGEAKRSLLELLKQQSKSKINLEMETSLVIMKTPGDFRRALIRIRDEVKEQKDAPLAAVEYDRVFAEATVTALKTKNLNFGVYY
jgi:hypothetical protein